MKILAPLALILHVTALVPSNGKPCASHDDCAEGSLCEDGRCTNPFVKGCLQAYAARKNTDASRFDYRVCNSDDASTGDTSNCIMSLFPSYKEVRIAAGNWESSILVSDATRTRAVLFYFLNKSVSICLVSSCQTDALLLTFISNANLDSDRMGLSDSSF